MEAALSIWVLPNKIHGPWSSAIVWFFMEQLGGKTGKKLWPLVTVRQIHSDLIHCVEAIPQGPLAGDGLITAIPQLMLGVLTADCIPVILADVKKQAVGVFHAGWRGTVKRIVEKGVGEMQRCFGSKPRDIKAAIGPGVHNCCYTVGEEVRTEFETQFAYADKLFHEEKESDPIRDKYPLLFLTKRAPGHSELPTNLFLNLVEANRRQLMDAGVSPKNIDECFSMYIMPQGFAVLPSQGKMGLPGE